MGFEPTTSWFGVRGATETQATEQTCYLIPIPASVILWNSIEFYRMHFHKEKLDCGSQQPGDTVVPTEIPLSLNRLHRFLTTISTYKQGLVIRSLVGVTPLIAQKLNTSLLIKMTPRTYRVQRPFVFDQSILENNTCCQKA